MVLAKVIQIHGESEKEILETGALLQDFLNKVPPADVRKLLLTAKNKPSMIKTAIKWA